MKYLRIILFLLLIIIQNGANCFGTNLKTKFYICDDAKITRYENNTEYLDQHPSLTKFLSKIHEPMHCL